MGHHPGDIAASTIQSSGAISPLVWMIIIFIAIAAGYFIYWLFSKDKKK